MSLRAHLTPLNIILVLLLLAAVVSGFILVPPGTRLPVHWGFSGTPNRYLPRDQALLLSPLIGIAVAALLIFVRRSGNPDASRSAVAVGVPATLGLFLVIETATVMVGAGMAVDMVRIIVLALGAMFVVIGNVLPKTQPTRIAGIRLPWTLRDPANWQATNRLGGWLMLLGGIVMVVAALLTGNPGVLLAIAIGVAALSSIIPALFSWRLSRGR